MQYLAYIGQRLNASVQRILIDYLKAKHPEKVTKKIAIEDQYEQIRSLHMFKRI